MLFGSYGHDCTMLRNAFTYAVSNQVGRYAICTRPIEGFVNAQHDGEYVGGSVPTGTSRSFHADGERQAGLRALGHPLIDTESEFTGALALSAIDAGWESRVSTLTDAGQSGAYWEPRGSGGSAMQAAWLSLT